MILNFSIAIFLLLPLD